MGAGSLLQMKTWYGQPSCRDGWLMEQSKEMLRTLALDPTNETAVHMRPSVAAELAPTP